MQPDMTTDREWLDRLRAQADDLVRQRDQHWNNYHRACGALDVVNHHINFGEAEVTRKLMAAQEAAKPAMETIAEAPAMTAQPASKAAKLRKK